MRQAKIGLALSGGGMRGLAHIGVLSVLEEEKIPLDFITGTSMGGIIALLYAAGVPLKRLREVGEEVHLLQIATPDPHRHGLLGHAKMAAYLADLLGRDDLTFEELHLPAAVVATDVETGEMVILNKGPIIPAMMATSAFPLMFAPVRYGGRWLVDGGATNNFPFDLVRAMGADRVIGVATPPSVKLGLEERKVPLRRLERITLLRLFTRPGEWYRPFVIAETSVGHTIGIVTQRRMELSPPDLLLTVSLPNVGTFATNLNHRIITAGEEVAREHIVELRALRDHPMPPPWKRQWHAFTLRLRRAIAAYRAPLYGLHPQEGKGGDTLSGGGSES